MSERLNVEGLKKLFGQGFVGTKKIAEALEVTPQRVNQMVLERRIKPYSRVGRTYTFLPEQVYHQLTKEKPKPTLIKITQEYAGDCKYPASAIYLDENGEVRNYDLFTFVADYLYEKALEDFKDTFEGDELDEVAIAAAYMDSDVIVSACLRDRAKKAKGEMYHLPHCYLVGYYFIKDLQRDFGDKQILKEWEEELKERLTLPEVVEELKKSKAFLDYFPLPDFVKEKAE